MVRQLSRFILPLALCGLVSGVALPQPAQQASGEKYALLVGVREYDKNELRSLHYSEADVTALADVLKAAGYRRVVLMTQTVGAKQVRFLPLAANIRKELAGLLKGREPGDTVLVAFAGHGVQFAGEQTPYFCPMDARLKDRKTLLSLDEVYQAMEGCSAGAKVLFADCCRNDPLSGFARGAGEVKLESVTRPQKRRPPGGVAAFFACSAGERAFESPQLQHGVFFHYVIEGLKGEAALRGEKGVTLDGLSAYVKRRVNDKVKDEFDAEAEQTPELVSRTRGAIELVPLKGSRNGNDGISRAQLKVEQARFFLRQNEPERALAVMNEAVKENPKLGLVYAGRGRVYDFQGEFDKALEDCNKALQLDPGLAVGYAIRAAVHADLKQPDRGLEDCNKALRLEPKLAIAYRNRGYCWAAKEAHDKAIADYSEALQLDSRDDTTYVLRAEAFNWKQEYGKAIADCTEAIRLNPKNDAAYEIRGFAFNWKGEHDKAIADCTEAIRLNPKNDAAYVSRGSAFNGKGEHDKAIADCNEAIKLNPKEAEAYKVRGFAFQGKGDQSSADADFAEYRRLGGTDQ